MIKSLYWVILEPWRRGVGRENRNVTVLHKQTLKACELAYVDFFFGWQFFPDKLFIHKEGKGSVLLVLVPMVCDFKLVWVVVGPMVAH